MAPLAMKKGLAAMVVLMAIIQARVMAQSGCTSVLMSLAPCLSYVSGSSSSPSTSCCSQLATVVQSQPRCLCMLLNGGASSLGVTLNETLALALPGACEVETPPISACNAAGGGPAMAPIVSPAASPQGDSAIGSPSDSSLSGGSKAASSTSQGSTLKNANSMKLYLRFTALALFMAMGSCGF